MRITSGGKSRDATAVKLWYEVYLLDETEDLIGGTWNTGDGERQGSGPRVLVIYWRNPCQ